MAEVALVCALGRRLDASESLEIAEYVRSHCARLAVTERGCVLALGPLARKRLPVSKRDRAPPGLRAGVMSLQQRVYWTSRGRGGERGRAPVLTQDAERARSARTPFVLCDADASRRCVNPDHLRMLGEPPDASLVPAGHAEEGSLCFGDSDGDNDGDGDGDGDSDDDVRISDGSSICSSSLWDDDSDADSGADSDDDGVGGGFSRWALKVPWTPRMAAHAAGMHVRDLRAILRAAQWSSPERTPSVPLLEPEEAPAPAQVQAEGPYLVQVATVPSSKMMLGYLS